MTGKQKFISLLLIALIGAAGYLYFRDTQAPEIRLSPGTGALNHKVKLSLTVQDAGSDLKQVRVVLASGDREKVLAQETFPEGQRQWLLEIHPAKHRPEQGPMEIRVETGDRSYHNRFKGNQITESFSFEYDSKAPIVSVLSTQHNLVKGGSGLIIYQVNETVTTTGMQIGPHFFPAFTLDNGNLACLFTFPYDLETDKDTPVLIARDTAGNEGRGKFFYRVRPVRFGKVRIDLDHRFLDGLYREFGDQYPDLNNPEDVFLKVNTELRKSNRAKLPELAADSSNTPLWSGKFLRQRGKQTGGFGNKRSYYVRGKRVDRQTHLGIDIASIASASVIAANSGRIVWADRLGIYGQCVIIDHGLGLQTLYGHLGQIAVSVGQEVAKGEEIGRSGMTGIAAGDHLHFGVLIGGLPANPVEWWDASWVTDHIEKKLAIQP